MIKQKCLATIVLLGALLLPGCATNALIKKNAMANRRSAPDLGRIMEAFVPVKETTLGPEYIGHLRKAVVDPIRAMQADHTVGWYAFLLHPCSKALIAASADNQVCLQIWLERPRGMDKERFRTMLLSAHFLGVGDSSLAEIAGLDKSMLKNTDWAYAWKMIGECSAWIVELLEDHKNDSISADQIIQFVHYITNGVFLGGQSMFLPTKQTF